MFFFEDLWWQQQANSAGKKDRFRIVHAEWFKSRDGAQEIRRKLGKLDLVFQFEHRDEILRCEPLARMIVETGAQLRNPFAGQREADGVGMSAKSGEQVMARLKRLEQVIRGN